MKKLWISLLPCLSIGVIAWGDGMAIPFWPAVTPAKWQSFLTSDQAAYDPREIIVYEPRQAAVIPFNGHEEILVLSVTMAASKPTGILEIVPLPAKPHVKLGDLEKMAQLEQLLIQKNQPRKPGPPGTMAGGPVPGASGDAGRVAQSARIAFTAKLGAHDLKAVEVADRDFFSQWVMQFMESQQAVRASVKPEFAGLIDNYLKRDFAWFVFDSIAVTKEAESRRPIEYRFTSDCVFYPLEISSLQEGHTTVDLLIVTQEPFSDFDVRYSRQIERGLQATIKRSELARVSGGWAAFMETPEIHLQMLTLRGYLKDFEVDFVAKYRGVI